MLKKFMKKLRNNRGESSIKEKSILVVEDNEVDRTFIQKVLEKKGYKVDCAVDGESGLQLAQNERFDLMILDFELPGMRGDEVCKRLKQDTSTQNLPVIFLTSSSSPNDIVSFYDLGAEHYLNKPIKGNDLIKQIETVLEELAN